MDRRREIEWWQKQADSNSLLAAVRATRDKAIMFFGAVAVLSEDESELLRTLEAHTIVATPSRDLLPKVNRVLRQNMQGLPRSEITLLKKEALFTLKDISALKTKAKQHLQLVRGRSE